jgi:hypothetical protein
MGLEIILLWLVLFSFVIAIGFPIYFILSKLYSRPRGEVKGYKARQKTASGFFSSEETGKALDIFSEVWNEIIGKENLKIVFDNLNIYWKKEPIDLGQSYVINGKTFSMASGLTRTKKDIDVWIFDKDKEKEQIKISDTAFAHELVHIALWNIEGDPDADHEDKLYSGWKKKHTEVERITNIRLKEKGL